MSIAYFDGIEIPYIHALEVDRELIGERARTIGGTMRQDAIAVKRTWRLETRPMTRHEANDLIQYLDGILYGAGEFDLDELPEPVTAYVVADDLVEERVLSFTRNGETYTDGRMLSLTIQEK